jgi:hypothetical protein
VALKTARRLYLRKAQFYYDMWEEGLAAVWRAKQDAQPGTPLPTDFPSRSKLAAARYTMVEDIDGADAVELARYAKLNFREARAVLTALAALT